MGIVINKQIGQSILTANYHNINGGEFGFNDNGGQVTVRVNSYADINARANGDGIAMQTWPRIELLPEEVQQLKTLLYGALSRHKDWKDATPADPEPQEIKTKEGM